MKRLAVFGALTFLISACGLDDMHDSTVRMDKTTQEMNANTKEMGETTKALKELTESVAKITEELYKTIGLVLLEVQQTNGKTGNLEVLMKQMEALTQRLATLTQSLHDESRHGFGGIARGDAIIRAMRTVSATEAKRAFVATYMRGFEFQYFSNQGKDTPEVRHELFLDAVIEFLNLVREFKAKSSKSSFYVNGQIPDPTIGDGTNDEAERMRSLTAVAVTMHLVDPAQKKVVHATGIEEYSLLDLLEESIEANQRKERGEFTGEMFPWMREVQGRVNYEDSLFLINLRYNTMISLALCNISPFCDDKGEATSVVLWKKRWTPTVADGRLSVLGDARRYLKEAQRLRRFFLENGYVLDRDGKDMKAIRLIYGLVDFSKVPNTLSAEQAKIVLDIQTYMTSLGKFDSEFLEGARWVHEPDAWDRDD